DRRSEVCLIPEKSCSAQPPDRSPEPWLTKTRSPSPVPPSSFLPQEKERREIFQNYRTANTETVFFGKGGCAACHQVNGRGSRLSPDLSSIGRWTAQSLRETILNPNQREGRERNVVVVKTRDGREIRGLRRNEDTFSLQLMDKIG